MSDFMFVLCFKVVLSQRALNRDLRSRSGTLMRVLIQAKMENSIVSLTFIYLV